VLQNAQLRADHLKYETQQRLLAALGRRSRQLISTTRSPESNTASREVLKKAAALHKALALAGKV